MKKIASLLMLSFLAGGVASGEDIVKPEGYQLMWHDEFDTDWRENSMWTFEEGFVRNHEDQYYQSDNANCVNGRLVIEARKESVKNKNYQAGSSDWTKNKEYSTYTSSCLKTSSSRGWTYGIFEVKAKIPAYTGCWPAIWTLGTGTGWPEQGEIDLMEFYQVGGKPHILANVCWGSGTRWSGKWNSKRIPYTHWTDKDPDWGDKFHTWKMVWDEEAIRLYLDDELLNETFLSQTVNKRNDDYFPYDNYNPFTKKQYLLLNLALGGDNGGSLTNTPFPCQYEVEYVRIFQKVKAEGYTSFDFEKQRPTYSFTFNGNPGDPYTVERSIDGGDWEKVDEGVTPEDYTATHHFEDTTLPQIIRSMKVAYRVVAKSGDKTFESEPSEISVPVMEGQGEVRAETRSINNLDWNIVLFDQSATFDKAPGVFFGGFTEGVPTKATYHIQDVGAKKFRFRVSPWKYQKTENLSRSIKTSLLAVNTDLKTLGGLPCEIGEANRISDTWKDIKFATPFEEIPVVIVSPYVYATSFPFVARVRNVTKEGFQIKLTCEKGVTDKFSSERLKYLAVVPGEGQIGDTKVLVGRTGENVGEKADLANISFCEGFTNPVFLAGLQTMNDDNTAMVRHTTPSSKGCAVYKELETSGKNDAVEKDAVGYIVVESSSAAGVATMDGGSRHFSAYIADGWLHLDASEGETVEIYNAAGMKMMSFVHNGEERSVESLPAGLYIVRSARGAVRLVK